jgi:hypothetical protein
MGSKALRVLALILATAVLGTAAHAEKPVKIPVAFGTWTGPHAGRFKSGVRSGVAKDCVVVRAEKARVIIDGEVSSEDNKHFKVRVMVKSPKTNELVETKEYSFSKPQLSQAQSHRLGRDVFEIARRAPAE